MELVEGKKLIHKQYETIKFFKVSKGKSWWDICYNISGNVDNVYEWLEEYEIYDCYFLESNCGMLFELKEVYTEN